MLTNISEKRKTYLVWIQYERANKVLVCHIAKFYFSSFWSSLTQVTFFRVLLIGRMILPGLHNVHHELLNRIWVEKMYNAKHMFLALVKATLDHEILWWMEPRPLQTKTWHTVYLYAHLGLTGDKLDSHALAHVNLTEMWMQASTAWSINKLK